MLRIGWDQLESLINDSPDVIAIVLADFSFLIDWDHDVYGPLKNRLICNKKFHFGNGECVDVGLFSLPNDRERFSLLHRLLLTENVKLIVNCPGVSFFSSIGDRLLREVSMWGEFSDTAIEAAGELKNFEWVVLADGSECDAPFYLLESQAT